jgi:ABC-type multidrug transport system fused ATPase/permease subunit
LCNDRRLNLQVDNFAGQSIFQALRRAVCDKAAGVNEA